MISKELKKELIRTYEKVNKSTIIILSQDNMNEIISLFRDNSDVSIIFKLLSCFNQKITEGSIENADYQFTKNLLEQYKAENIALKEQLAQQNKLISSYNGMYLNRAKVAAGIRKPARIEGIEPNTIRQYINAGYSMNQIADKLGCSVSTLYRRLR